jgi:hypothetical protein
MISLGDMRLFLAETRSAPTGFLAGETTASFSGGIGLTVCSQLTKLSDIVVIVVVGIVRREADVELTDRRGRRQLALISSRLEVMFVRLK